MKQIEKMAKKNLALISHSILQDLLQIVDKGDLSEVVKIIATKMEVSVCSCYLLRSGDLLELAATYGLSSSAVGKTFLHITEGVVGEVARTQKTVNLKNAWKSENFAYKPETDEKDIKSFLGVPVLNRGKIYGVLCIQNKTAERFLPEEAELLKTISMFISESMLANLSIEKEGFLSIQSNNDNLFYGQEISSGLGIGEAVLHRQIQPIIKIVAKDTKKEQVRLTKALEEMQEQISTMLSEMSAQKGEHVDILSTYLMFSNDKSWVSKLQEGVLSGLTAEAAAQKVFEGIKLRLEQSSDDYLKARISDFQDLTTRLISHLSGNIVIDLDKLPKEFILCAQNMGPSELFDYEISRIKGIVLEEGSKNMHVAIIARSLGIPIVGGLPKILRRIEKGDTVIVNALKAEIYINPASETEEKFRKELTVLEKKEKIRERLLDVPTRTLDGVDIKLNANVGLLIDMDSKGATSADGVGLYRTELAFMMSSTLPDVQTQISIYKSVLDKADGRPVIFRTLDIGSDKILQYFKGQKEENPAMGWRSIRISLDRKAIFRHQLRALLRAAAGQDLYVMFPMISNVSEFKEAKKTLDKEINQEKARGNQVPKNIFVGTMIEVPALIFHLKTILPYLDFVSVGTNDLTQFLYACDRGNSDVYERYDPLSPPMLEVLGIIQKECKKANVKCSICGEMAGNPIDAMVLLGLGFTSLSMNPLKIISVKEMVLSLDTKLLKEYINSFKNSSYDSLREHFRSFAVDHGIVIDNN